MTENKKTDNVDENFYDVMTDKLINLAQMPKFTDLFCIGDVQRPIMTNQGLISFQPWNRWSINLEQNTNLIFEDLWPQKKDSYTNRNVHTWWAKNGLNQLLFNMDIDFPREKYYQLEQYLVNAYDVQQEIFKQNPTSQFGRNERLCNDLIKLGKRCLFLSPQEYAMCLVDLMLKHTR